MYLDQCKHSAKLIRMQRDAVLVLLDLVFPGISAGQTSDKISFRVLCGLGQPSGMFKDNQWFVRGIMSLDLHT